VRLALKVIQKAGDFVDIILPYSNPQSTYEICTDRKYSMILTPRNRTVI